MRIYVASSWRNERQPAVVELLREAGHDVLWIKESMPGLGDLLSAIVDRLVEQFR